MRKELYEGCRVEHIIYGSQGTVKSIIPNLDMVIVKWDSGMESTEYPSSLEKI